jgi:rhodanese-related sulfurtransferase
VKKTQEKKKRHPRKAHAGKWALWGGIFMVVLATLVIYVLNRQAQSLNSNQTDQPGQTQQFVQTQPAAAQATSKDSPAGAISLSQLFLIYQNGKAFFLDIRVPVDFALYRIPNSTSIPLAELESRLSEVPSDKDIVIVCMISADCLSARDILLNAGITRLFPMTDGIENWVLQGYPFEGAFPN